MRLKFGRGWSFCYLGVLGKNLFGEDGGVYLVTPWGRLCGTMNKTWIILVRTFSLLIL